MIEVPQSAEIEVQQMEDLQADGDQKALSPIQQKLQQKFDIFDIKDKTEQKIITKFFENIENKLPETHQEELIKYIENIDNNTIKEILTFDEIDQEEESNIITESIEKIDINTGQPVIKTHSTIKDERSTIEDERSTIEDERSTIEDERSTIEDERSTIEDERSTIETRKEINEETKQLIEQAEKDYNQLLQDKPELEPNQQQLYEQQQELKQNGSLQKLIDQGFSQEQISNYISFSYVYTNHQEAIQNTDFAKSYEKLENKLFPKTRSFTPKLLKSENATSYQDEIIKSNPKINNYVQQINGGSSNYQEKSKEIEKLNNNEIKEEFDKEKNQELFNKYKTLLPQEPKEDENKTTEENLQEKTKRQRNILLEINSLEEQTQSTIQKRVFGSTISGLTSFFDFSTGQKENLGEDFEFSREKGFDIDPVNNIFYLGGNIKENNINISYNLGNGNLSVEDHLFQTQDQNVLNFGKSKFQDLKIKLPPIQLLTEQARQISEKEVSGKNSQEYINNLEKNIHESLLLNFRGNQEIVKIRLERNIQKNLAAQETLSDFKSIISPENKNIYGNNFNKQEKPELFNLVKILDDSLENYTISKSKEFRENIGTLIKFIQESTEKQGEQNIIGKFFRKLFKKQENKSTIETEEKNTKNLLDTIEKLSIKKEGKKIIDINLLKKTVLETQKAEPNLDKIPEPLSESITNPNPGKLLEQEGLRQDRPPTA